MNLPVYPKLRWRWRARGMADVLTPHWLHDCPNRRGGQLVISPHIAETTGCPDCGEKPSPRKLEQAS